MVWTHFTQNLPECLLLPCLGVSARSLPRACLGPPSPACPPHLPTAPISLWLFLCQLAHADGTFRKLALESNVPGSEDIKEGFQYVGTAVPQVEFTCRQQQGCVTLASPLKGKGQAFLSALCSGEYLSQVKSFTPTITSRQDTFKVHSMRGATSK